MILLSLNIRGVGGPLKQASMRRIIDQTQPSIIFLQETLVAASVARDFMHLLRPSWLSCAASSVGTSGGLLVTWDPAYFNLSPMLSPGGILLSGTCLELNRQINFLNVYGPCTGRRDFWQRLDNLGLLAAENLILAGDLNLTTSSLETWGDLALSDPLTSFFQQLFFKNALIDIKPPEILPTWSNGRQGAAKISKRLDRFLIAESLLLPSYNTRAWVNLPFLSDHAPICLQLGEGRIHKGSTFQIQRTVVEGSDF
jgi:endonuclease/exonuclease/phosphatase family metal-dependent hydrolase